MGSKREKKRAQFEAKYASDEGGNAAPYVATGRDEWLAHYSPTSVEFFFRDRKGAVCGAGPQADVDAAGRALFRARVLDNRPPLGNAPQSIKDAYDQGYFVVPAAIEAGAAS